VEQGPSDTLGEPWGREASDGGAPGTRHARTPQTPGELPGLDELLTNGRFLSCKTLIDTIR
jgi:hypothetical protein